MGLLDELMITPEDKTRAQYEGLLSMGLGILANNTSKNPFPAFAKGGMMGMDQYKSSLGELRQQKMQDFMLKQKATELAKAQQQEELQAQFLANPAIPETIRQAAKAGMINPADLMKPQTMAEGSQLVSPMLNMMGKNGTIAQGPAKAPKMSIVSINTPKGWQDYQAADGVPDYTKPQGIPYRKGKDAADIVQNVSNAAETEQSKAWGKTLGEMRSNIAKGAFSAPSKLKQLDRMEQLLTGVEGGKLSPVGMDIASAANSLGLKVDPKLGNKEAAESLAIEIAGAFREPGTGPMTDKDFDNYLKRVPSLSKTAEGRADITRTMRAALKRDLEIQKITSDYAKARNGNIDDGLVQVIAEYVAKNPVVASGSMDVRARADEIIGR